MERLFLVDGHNLLFRMFYGMPPISAGDGTYMHAVVGCMGALLRSIGMLSPTRMLVLFDSPDNGDRRSLCADYKANRPDYSAMAPEDCPFTQLPLLYRTLSHSGIPYAEIHGCEADDAIAAYARQTPDDWDVVICSTDRDYFQLIDDRVSVFLYKGYDSSLVTPESVFARYGVSPDKFADFKCLVGDHSDNITGPAQSVRRPCRDPRPQRRGAVSLCPQGAAGGLPSARTEPRPHRAVRRRTAARGSRFAHH